MTVVLLYCPSISSILAPVAADLPCFIKRRGVSKVPNRLRNVLCHRLVVLHDDEEQEDPPKFSNSSALRFAS